MFTDQWQKIKDTVEDVGLKNGVIIVDNIYTSTNQDLSDNNALQQILSMIQLIKTQTGNSIVLVGHHNKSSNHDEEPILSKGLIHGGKHLTNYVHNVFQIGDSTLGTDLRRGKITKVRDEHCELNGMAFKLNWNREEVLFERGAVIVNEKLHCVEANEKWEIKLLKDFYIYTNKQEFDRKRIWSFLESDQGWMPTTYNINTKLTRYLKTMTKWGYIQKEKHGLYSFNHLEMD
jgi:RecA-family ATPase